MCLSAICICCCQYDHDHQDLFVLTTISALYSLFINSEHIIAYACVHIAFVHLFTKHCKLTLHVGF